MARAIHTRLILKGILEAQTPLSLSGAQTGLVADITVARNGLGQIYLPGTSLAGTLRSYSEHLQLPARDRNTLLGWWGCHLEDDPASRFLVDDAPIVNETRLELWHGVGIDRQWGTAAKGVLYEREVVPRGAQFSFNLELETGEPAELGLARAVMQTLRQALSEGRIGIGGATTRGLGQIKLTQSRASEQNWNSRAGVLAALRGDAE
jgi:CRISPR/Cas system CSM-associated protein Csm3 (group 7 of RAMP superfamily)